MTLLPEDGAGGPSALEPNGAPGLDARVAALEQQLGALRTELQALKATNVPASRPEAPARVPPPRTSFPPPPPLQSGNQGVPEILQEHRARAPVASLEERLGAKWLMLVSILLLLIGAAWFLTWAFENKWIGPRGQILAGLVAGIALIVWSERFRLRKLAGFSYALKAVGSGLLYLSLWASFQVYHLVPPSIAFAAMVCVTAWNAIMAWSQDGPVLAWYALLGAYLTPVLISTGGDHEIFLFSYLWIIAASLLALVRLKRWNQLLLAALPVTSLFFIAWYSQSFEASKAGITATFALLLWAVFAAAPIVADDAESLITNIILPLGAAVFGALTLYSVLVDSGRHDWQPWCAVAFAAVYLGLARVTKATASAVHLSLGIVFLTVAIPLKATGRGITLGWLVEAVALLWIATLSSVDARAQTALRWLGWGAMLLGVAGALVEPYILGSSVHPFLNREFATALGAVFALAAAIWLSREMKPTDRSQAISATALVTLNFVLLAAMRREIFLAFEAGAQGASWEYANFCFSGWMMLQGAALLALGFWKRQTLTRWLGLILLGATVIKAFAYDMRALGTGYRVVSYLGLGVLLMAVSFAYQKDLLGLRDDAPQPPPDPAEGEA